ncbi:Na+/H+ antiporter NhaA [Hymenobacter taeanensis]|uniref:Na(+)/H(+) antiporter NhaA n=1 Tax=Hymenobacter taeanensis TaxID=2735321 RepID=A0A6M6BKW2_9BACT|nr:MULTISPECIES: Na+/H+ antiporter NhaA [Hymenobacter]QJX48083.1 Na+/H+ antiporter NhaA [Hymenobacter taeanensis]UOQ82457.1 Na+/H+ antiporter NhaA [Hymenobacter sp. 5414T-23]
MTVVVGDFVRPLVRPFTEFFRREAAGGIMLLLSSVLALVLANLKGGVANYFPGIWEEHLQIGINNFTLNKSLLHWINDGLMAVFFLIVGLEIKREVLEGELASFQKAALPIAGALGGMVVPALLYTYFNQGQPTANGWGIPMATDIAFALAVLQLLGPRVPLALKVFLTALAIVDDLGAVLVIAGFYTQELQLSYLFMAFGAWSALWFINVLGGRSLWFYLPLGVALWYFTLQSGVHATLAGVLLAVTIPLRIGHTRPVLFHLIERRLAFLQQEAHTHETDPRTISEELEALAEAVSSPAQRLEQRLHGLVAFGIIPLFAFANTSLVIEPAVFEQLFSPLGLGILVGLVVGKPLGIGLLAWATVKLGWATLPVGVTWRHLWGAGVLAGIGFTMSIFITLLALGEGSEGEAVAKTAILLASLVAGALGFLLLQTTPMPPSPPPHVPPAT